ncbi:MAG: hypothetical protein JNK15_17585 [Planctomycetes bacterium]|nr:hypothetical protein [Planctomycetota bacterium]
MHHPLLDRRGASHAARTGARATISLWLATAACSPGWAWRHDQVATAPPPCAALATPGTRAGLVQELDQPHREFPADRVAMWRMVAVDGKCTAVPRGPGPLPRRDYTLVVEFDASDRVSRWSLVEALWH